MAGSDHDVQIVDGRLEVRLASPLPLADLVRRVGAELGAEVVVRGDPGTVGPLALAGLTPAEALHRLAGRNAIALLFADEAIVTIVLAAPARVAPAMAAASERPAPAARSLSRGAAVRDVVALGYRSDKAARAELLRLAGASDEPAVRGAAVAALARVAGPDAGAAIERALADPDPPVRQQAAAALDTRLGPRAATRLRAVLAGETDAEVRAEIERLLSARPPAGG